MRMSKKKKLFSSGALIGLTTLSISLASVPKRVTDDTAIYQNLSEIRVPKGTRPNFDAEIARLSNLEGRYREKLPALSRRAQLKGPMQRIAQQKYQFSGTKRPAITRQ